MWRPYGKESHSTRGSRECFGCVFDLRACTRQAVSLTPLYVMVLVSVCARRRAGPPVHVYDRARAGCTRGLKTAGTAQRGRAERRPERAEQPTAGQLRRSDRPRRSAAAA